MAEAVTDRRPDESISLVQTYARIGGILGILSLIAGGFGEAFVPSRLIVRGDAAATAANILGSSELFRLGFAGYLVEGLCDVGLALVLYALLRPVHRDLALLGLFFRLIGTTGFAMSQVLYFSALPLVTSAAGLQALSEAQRGALALLSLNVSMFGQTLFMMFYGMGFLVFGYLLLRARYFPKFLGVLVLLMGAGFVARTFLWVLAPAYASPWLLLVAAPAGLALSLWLLVKGVDPAKWREQNAVRAPDSL